MLQLRQVKKEYGERTILSIPDLTLSPGIYWLTGLNGSGKTTLLRILSGMVPFSGDILLNGIHIRKNPVLYRTMIGFAEAEPTYPPFLAGKELIRFYQDIRKTSNHVIKELTEQLSFEEFLASPIGTYSSGMLKRLSILLAFIGDTKLILLDEPLATLDTEAVSNLPVLMMDYHRKFGTSFIFSSHAAFAGDELIIDRKLNVRDQTLHSIE